MIWIRMVFLALKWILFPVICLSSIWLFNSSPWENHHAIKFGKPSISMDHLLIMAMLVITRLGKFSLHPIKSPLKSPLKSSKSPLKSPLKSLSTGKHSRRLHGDRTARNTFRSSVYDHSPPLGRPGTQWSLVVNCECWWSFSNPF